MTYNGITFLDSTHVSGTDMDLYFTQDPAKVWKQQKCLMLVVEDANALGNSIAVDYDNVGVATYSPDANGKCIVDLTDWIRAFGGGDIDVEVQEGYSETITFAVVGLINPADLLIPYHPYTYDFIILPPTKMYSASMLGDSIKIGLFAENTGKDYQLRTLNRNGTTPVYDGIPLQYQYAGGGILASFSDGQWTEYGVYKTTQRICGVEYALVRWESVTGVTRCHVLEAKKHTIGSGGDYSLLPLNNEYIEIKGREDGLTLKIDGLTPYDLWYYADILTSSKVEVSFDGVTWDRVGIATKNITIPDGNAGDGKLEIKVNYKRYDAVAM